MSCASGSLDAGAAPEQPSCMPPPRLPSRPGDTWGASFVFDTARDVRAVSSRGGLVVAGGEELHLLRAGTQSMASRAPPLELVPLFAAAAEPRAPWRYAIASKELVAVVFRTKEGGDQIVRLRCKTPGRSATHLAWGRAGTESSLYIRWDDGEVVRMRQDMSGVEAPELPPMDAIAADDAGVLALASFDASAPRAYVTRDGENVELRAIDPPARPSRRVHLAVAGDAVAYALETGGVFVSREAEAPFVPCEPLATAGPIDFEGISSDAALFGATRHAGVVSITRVDRDGVAVRIADFGSDREVVPELTAISWDASREMVWGASPRMGLVTCTAPGAKHGRKPPPS
jgi:hypothetical protein